MNDTPANQLRKLVAAYAGQPVIVHSDLLHAGVFVPPSVRRSQVLAGHVAVLESLGAELLIPAFNYQFPKTREIDLRTAPVELGPLGGHMLTSWAAERTLDPVFSFAVKKALPVPDLAIDPLVAFGSSTAFATVAESSGAIMMYGAGLLSFTMLHHLEILSGGPVYRYDKDFAGTAIAWDGRRHAINYRYHVRPLGKNLDYDWPRIFQLLERDGLLAAVRSSAGVHAFVMPMQGLRQWVLDALKRDPFFLIDGPSRAWAEPLVQKLGRRLVRADFEP